MTKHPITPPPELVQHWIAQVWHEGTPVQVAASDLHVATQAARWGADKMLEAEPHGPTDEELDDLWTEIDGAGEIWAWQEYARAVLARWGRPALPAGTEEGQS